MEAKARTNYELLRRRHRRLPIVGASVMGCVCLVAAFGRHRWPNLAVIAGKENSWYFVGVFMAVFLPMQTWYMRSTPCLRCGKPLGKIASNALSTMDVPTDCPHCGLKVEEQVP